MTRIFKAQLLNELRQAKFTEAAENADGDIIPDPRFPGLVITQQHIRFSEDASQEERDLAHGEATDILLRTRAACHAWDNSDPFLKTCDAPENFNVVSEFGEVVLAVRNDGPRGLHFATWDYNHDRTGLSHGHYTTSYTGAMEDYAVRSGLVRQEQIIDPANAPMLYRALQTVANNYCLSNEHADQVNQLCQQLRDLDQYVADKSEQIQMDPASHYMPDETMEPEMGM